MITKLKIDQYYRQHADLPLIDVRSPGEFQKGHIPGAFNIALFDDDERAQVGTMYVQQSREKAIELGYKFVTPKLLDFITKSERVSPSKEVVVHCWRGGMRSAAFAQHLADNGFKKVYLIEGGYKAYRKLVLNTFEIPFKLNVLGGYTGSGKTHILESVKDLGHQVIDLEGIACHKGSAFGGIGLPDQPTVEQFENNLFEEFRQLDFSKPIWIEDESHNIGRVKVPINLFTQMRNQTLFFLDIPVEKRAGMLVEDYGKCEAEQLATSIQRIHKRLGGLAVKNALRYLEEDNYFEVAKIALFYYDKSYLTGMKSREKSKVITIELEDTDAAKNAQTILNQIESYV
ncbi:tRNA 2-selenouridine(34) synthase MnmH [Mangrovibacterium lignilyticum]|uniref:tRNA 2-selenouridine(34) synthase MnmH n=1 Tax=Mangrovibacterium lignilyticum TaxID=2668052 RepID=UPI0013CF45DB|nr:tRNA 2-selenouridine(34) synthase MnmH [Mangrovibacterium lignilyticum]